MEQRINLMRSGRAGWLVLLAVAVAWGCAQPRVAELYPQVAEFDGREIDRFDFVNTEPFSADSLSSLTETRETRCRLLGFMPFCFPGTDWGRRVGRVEMRAIGDDLSRLAALYRQNGYFGTLVVPEIEELPDEDGVWVRFVVERGDGILMDDVLVEGTEGIADPDSLQAQLPLQPGELFDLAEFVASADTVSEALRRRGHAYAEVLRNYAVDTIQNRATVWLLAIPGPRVTVDSVVVDGIQELRRGDVIRQLTFSPGDLLRLTDLRASQRNLYDLSLVRFASVGVAADSMQRTPEDSTTATVRIAISEAPEHVVEAGVSFGLVDCFGAQGRWTDRSVLGGGREVTLRGSVSRIGLGDPVSGLQDGLCSDGADREIATQVDYRVSADFTQPFFITSRNQVTATTFSERQSEPDLFQRTATGVRLAVTNRLRPGEFLTGALEAEFRSTRGRPVLYCFELRACTEEDVARFTGSRWRTGLAANWIRDRSNSAVNPTAGYIVRSRTSWSTGLLGSDYDFVRLSADGSIYQSLGRGWVAAGFARFGTFLTRASLGPSDFTPPEERFFAGGASSVRGFSRSTLGPGLYLARDAADPDDIVLSDTLRVDFFPTGGTSVSVLSAETRLPSPVLRDLLRLALFVDAGTVGLSPVWNVESQWRITPGVGLRVQTPVGPARIDLGYNPHPPPRAPLLAVDPETGDLIRLSDSFVPRNPAWNDSNRFALHIAVGQAF
jgi:outer membrane protein assembly factor BamA